MLNYTLKRGFLQWELDGSVITVQELKERKYHMTVLNYGQVLTKARAEDDQNVASSICQVLGIIYKFQFPIQNVLNVKLQELMDSVPYVPAPNHGICMNIDIAVGSTVDASNIVMTKFDDWFGNKSAYPVEGKQESQSLDMNKVGYMNNPKKWAANTKFGQKRIELLDRLIEEFKCEN